MTDDSSRVRIVTRAIDVLLSLEGGAKGLARVAHDTNLTKPTGHRLLWTLSISQLVFQDPATSDYVLGPGCLRVAVTVRRGLGGLGLMARSHLETPFELSQETVALHVPAGTQRVGVVQVPSPHPVRYISNVGAGKPIYTDSMGRVLLVFIADHDRQVLFSRLYLVAVTPFAVSDCGLLEKQINEARRRGYAISREEQAKGLAAIRKPVCAANGHVLAALSVLSDQPHDRCHKTRLRLLVNRSAQVISETLGYKKNERSGRRCLTATGDGRFGSRLHSEHPRPLLPEMS